MGSNDTIIRIRDLRVAFGDHVVLDGADLDVQRGEILGIVGGSGTGKSVTLRCVLGLLHPQGGSIQVFDQDILQISESARMALARRWGVLFQNGALFTSLNVLQNIQVPLKEYFNLPQPIMDGIAHMKLSMVGLAPEVGQRMPSELSGGMRKRVGIARALVLDPEILFLDEPTAGLDPIGAAAFDELIAELRRTLDLTVVLVTHDLDTLHAICDRIAVIADKKVKVVGTMEDMLRQTHPWIREYFHGPRARAASVSGVTDA